MDVRRLPEKALATNDGPASPNGRRSGPVAPRRSSALQPERPPRVARASACESLGTTFPPCIARFMRRSWRVATTRTE
jgi:hypothetical protein